MLARARGSIAATGVSIRRLRPHSDLQAALASASEKVTLELSDATVLKASRTGVNASAGAGVWRGRVDATGGQVTLMWWADGRMAGTVQNEGRYHLIRPMGNGLHAVVELSEDLMPPEHQPQMLVSSNDRFGQSNGALALRSVTAGMGDASKRPAAPKTGSAPPARGKPNGASGDVIIDVMVAYTKKAALNYSDIERELIPAAKARGLGILPYFPLASGLLTGKYRRGAPLPLGSRLARSAHHAQDFISERNWRIVGELTAFAARRGRSLLALAVSWLLRDAVVASVIAGATTPEQVEQNVAAAGWTLSAEELAEIDRITM